MSYETDERLKSFLDTNQLAREQMCLAVLAVDSHFKVSRIRGDVNSFSKVFVFSPFPGEKLREGLFS
jgi:hypothetical protein